ncbi:MAG TPA: histidinol-phosphate transaminase [Bacteroidales bacterium]|nr:histidinol-phosphate transaminase [Bacteroidales bacterium]
MYAFENEMSFAMLPDKYFRPHILSLEPYSTARHEYNGPAAIWLDANENPYKSGLNRYPDPKQSELRKAISQLRQINADQVFTGSGSDEIIDLLIRLFCEPHKDKVLVLPPTYGMYAVAAAVHNVAVEEIMLTADFQPDVEKVLKSDAKLLFLCSPNNPTGNVMDSKDIELILRGFDGIVAVDEAYIDFSPESSVLKHLDTYPNLVVMQTFSKAYGLAAARVGMAFAHRSIIAALDRIKLPYNLGDLSARAAINALRKRKHVEQQVQTIVRNRENLSKKLQQLACVEKVFPSDANFLLVRFVEHKKIFAHLIAKGIIVRDRSHQAALSGCLRLTVGTKADNERLIEALKTLN